MNTRETEEIQLLLIEDDPGYAAFLQEEICEDKESTFLLTHKKNLGEGLNALAHNHFDVILLDLILPNSEGLDTYRRVHSASREIPIVIITSLDDQHTAHAAVLEGAEDYLFKTDLNSTILIRSLSYAVWRHRAQKRLRESEASLLSLKKAVESMQIGVTVTDLVGTIIYTNPSEALMHGWEVDELIGKDARIFAPPESHKPMTRDEIISMTSLTRETINIRKDGTTFPVRITSDIVKSELDEPMFIVSTCEEITERKRYEEELTRAKGLLEERVEERTRELYRTNRALTQELDEKLKIEQQLKQASDEWRATFDSISDPVSIQDKDFRILKTNSEFARALKKTPQDIIGKTCFELLYQRTSACPGCPHERVFAEKKPTTVEVKDKTKDIYQQVSFSPILGDEESIIGTVRIAKDITAQKIAENEREELITELKEALAQVKLLSGLLPICSSCKRIRGDKGYWESIEVYITEHSEADFTHGICPECMEKLYPGYKPKK
jgi:PAS domain S-box-containing protein